MEYSRAEKTSTLALRRKKLLLKRAEINEKISGDIHFRATCSHPNSLLGYPLVVLRHRHNLSLWIDCLLYRQAAFAVLRATYMFMQRFNDDLPTTVQTLTGLVCTVLLGIAALAPILDAPLRARARQHQGLGCVAVRGRRGGVQASTKSR